MCTCTIFAVFLYDLSERSCVVCVNVKRGRKFARTVWKTNFPRVEFKSRLEVKNALNWKSFNDPSAKHLRKICRRSTSFRIAFFYGPPHFCFPSRLEVIKHPALWKTAFSFLAFFHSELSLVYFFPCSVCEHTFSLVYRKYVSV